MGGATPRTSRGSYDTPGETAGVAVVGDLAFVADASAGLQVIDIANPGALSSVGSIQPVGVAWDVAVSGDRVFLSGNDLHVIDVSVPSAPSLVATIATTGQARGIDVWGSMVLVAGPTALNDNQWHHAVVEADVAAATHTIYIDGARAAQAPSAVAWQLTYLGVGATAYWDGFHGTNGLIDERAFYDLSSGSTTGAGIAAHYYAMSPNVTSVPPDAELPTRSALHPSVPNPSNPSTTIRFDLQRAEEVELTIYDVSGRSWRHGG